MTYSQNTKLTSDFSYSFRMTEKNLNYKRDESRVEAVRKLVDAIEENKGGDNQ